jgi:hypothetical protein
MTPENKQEANAKIHRAFGNVPCPCGNSNCWHDKKGFNHWAPDYFSPTLPVETRLEMWEALTEEEVEQLTELIHTKIFKESKTSPGYQSVIKGSIHFALSPEFVPAWCKIRLGMEVL